MITHARLVELLRYQPETGEFVWIIGERAGMRAGTASTNGRKKWRIKISGKAYRRSRLAWFYMTGQWPIEIDHKDLDAMNDRWENLREANRSQNQANKGLQRNNTSGFKGIVKQGGRWVARAGLNGVKTYLGSFPTQQSAAHAYESAMVETYGEFARFDSGALLGS